MIAPDGHKTPATPRLHRRLACWVYEGVLLFGVIAPAGLVYALATQQRHALIGTRGLQLWLFLVIGLYFVWFWSRRGQTLAMRTWHIHVATNDGLPLTAPRALLRYLLSWMWFLPALATVHLAGLKGAVPIAFVVLAGVLGYAGLTRLHPSRQFWHDVLAGTRLVDKRP